MRRVYQLYIVVLCLAGVLFARSEQALIVDHTCTDISQIPEWAINKAKEKLHIAYGHTSHGSQITTGMNGLVDFANGGGQGLGTAGGYLFLE